MEFEGALIIDVIMCIVYLVRKEGRSKNFLSIFGSTFIYFSTIRYFLFSGCLNAGLD